MDQMLIWALVYRELARRKRYARSEDEFYRDGDGSIRSLLRDAWPTLARGRGPGR